MLASSHHRTILLTGAAGRIGSAFSQDVGSRYRFRLADRQFASLPAVDGQTHEALRLDVADLDSCRAPCAGIDTVVHLAADPDPDPDFYGSLLEANIKGTYNMFRAARDEGCRRVVFASSTQAIEGYLLDQQVTSAMPVRPKNLYGASKCFGEAVASYFAHREGLSAIAVRIGNYNDFRPGQAHTARDTSAYLSRRDMAQLLMRCIDAPDVRFASVHGVSNNRFKRLDLSDTRTLLGYEPEDDTFETLGIPLQD